MYPSLCEIWIPPNVEFYAQQNQLNSNFIHLKYKQWIYTVLKSSIQCVYLKYGDNSLVFLQNTRCLPVKSFFNSDIVHQVSFCRGMKFNLRVYNERHNKEVRLKPNNSDLQQTKQSSSSKSKVNRIILRIFDLCFLHLSMVVTFTYIWKQHRCFA